MGAFEAGIFTLIYLVPAVLAFPRGAHGEWPGAGLFWYGVAAAVAVWVMRARAKAATSLRGSRDRSLIAVTMALPAYAALIYMYR